MPEGFWRRRENRIPRTALWIAADRRRTDPFAEAFLREAGELQTWSGSTFAARTAFFDDRVAALGPRAAQAVLLGAGLDTRALRGALPAGTAVYEVDLPVVFQFKEPVLQANSHLGRGHADAMAARRVIPCDLERDDWSTMLLASGFSREKTTLWIAEGLVFYLTDQTVQGIFDSIKSLSAPSSMLVFDCISKAFARSLAGEPGDHWGHDDPVGLLSKFGMTAHLSPSAGSGRFFVEASIG